MLHVQIKLAVATTQCHIWLSLATKRNFCLTFSYPADSVPRQKKMRATCVALVLAVLLSSTLAKPMAYVDRDGQNGINNDYLQYLLRRHGNGIIQTVLSHSYQ